MYLIMLICSPDHFTQLRDILKESLKPEELTGANLDLQATTDVKRIVNSVIARLESEADKSDKILLGLQKVAEIGDIAIQHQPETTALIWAGVRFVLQVNLY